MKMRARLCCFLLAVVAGCGNGDPNRIELFPLDSNSSGVTCDQGIVCASPTPYCYESLCVACLTDTNCGNKFCEPSSHTCVECASSGDCKNDKPYCQSNQCRQCLVPENCGDPLLTCDTRDGKCVPACASDDDCSGPNPACLPELAVCGACNGDADCPEDRYCEDNKCVACRGDGDCDPAKPHCDLEKLECVACKVDGACDPAKPHCDLEKFECVECLMDDDCGAERLCDDMHKCL